MPAMTQLTFRDFAGAIMGADTARAAEALEQLLGLDRSAATAAAIHFQESMTKAPDFMSMAMGLRTAVTSGSDAEIGTLLGDCFGLTDAAIPAAIATLRKQYPG
jgi:hypothetical protein